MHELAICERLVEVVDREVARLRPPPAGVRRAHLVVGRLHAIVQPVLRDAYALLTADGVAAGSTLEITDAPVVGECSGCGWRGELQIPRFQCQHCGSLDLEIVGGRELFLESIEVIEADAER